MSLVNSYFLRYRVILASLVRRFSPLLRVFRTFLGLAMDTGLVASYYGHVFLTL